MNLRLLTMLMRLVACIAAMTVVSAQAATVLWTPSNITCAAWYDASDTNTIVQTAGAVTNWNDISGNGYNLVQETPSKQPVTASDTIGGLNAINFDGVADDMHTSVNPFGLAVTNASIFMAYKPTVVNANRI